MKIILVNPYFDSHIIIPPLGLGYLSSSLKKNHPDADISLVDCLCDNIKNERLVKIIEQKRPDLVGLTIYSMFYENAKALIKGIKGIDSKINIVIGGPHVSALPVFSLEDSNADFAIFGEGEETFVQLVSQLRNQEKDFSAIRGLCYWDSGKVVENASQDLWENISEIPWPDWQSINPSRYPPAPHGGVYKRFPIAPLITTRGCPFCCKFCGSRSTWGSKIRYRAKEDVVDEVEYLVDNYGVREFYFEDDNFTFTKEHAAGICQEIIKRRLNIIWSCPNGIRIDTIDKELIAIMKKSGCYLLAFGIESGSQEILDKMGKSLDINIVYNVLKMVRLAGIETWGAFIIGLPGENKNTIRQTLSFAKRLPLDRAQFCNFMPIPGTPLFDLWLRQRNISNLKNIPWGELNFFGRSVYDIEGVNSQELTLWHKRVFFSFYARPGVFLHMLLQLKFNQLKYLSRRFKDYILK